VRTHPQKNSRANKQNDDDHSASTTTIIAAANNTATLRYSSTRGSKHHNIIITTKLRLFTTQIGGDMRFDDTPMFNKSKSCTKINR
jgi:hypothetical protein